MNEKKITIYDIAERSGCSAVTVHRALSGKGRISAATKQRVLQVAEQLGYKVNPAAQGLRRTPIKLGAVLFCPVEEYVDAIADGVRACAASLEKYNVSVQLHKLPYTDNTDCVAAMCARIDALVEDGCRGILLFSSAMVEEMEPLYTCVERHAENGIRFATVANDIPHINKAVHVGVNAFMAGQMAAELLSLSCRGRAVALLAASTSSPVNREYIEGFMQFADVFSRVSLYEHFDDKEKVATITRQMLAENPDLCGVYMTTASSVLACRYMEDDLDLSVITTDLLAETPSLLQQKKANAVLFQNPFKQGRTALRALYDCLVENRNGGTALITPHILLSSNLESYLFEKEEPLDEHTL